jgi:iron(II)-dependent oxidoreductase
MALKLFSRKRENAESADAGRPAVGPATNRPKASPRAIAAIPFEPAETVKLSEDSLYRQIELERLGIVFREYDRWEKHPDLEEAWRAVSDELDHRFALVPEGFASLPRTLDDGPGSPEIDIETPPFLLARWAVTNAQYQKFVDIGAYTELALWPEEIWPHLIDFKDLTGHPGPRFWREGRHNRHLGHHPVVGISVCEAAAYARWAGFRLPTEAEWQMAASWRIRSSANVLRRYPWGDALDVSKCNIWASGVGGTVPVTEYANGSAPNGVCQLCGNVWEWTASNFDMTDAEGSPVVGDMIMTSIRGGAYDTYFAAQTTSCFRTGLASLARAHNVGFRLAMDVPGDR